MKGGEAKVSRWAPGRILVGLVVQVVLVLMVSSAAPASALEPEGEAPDVRGASGHLHPPSDPQQPALPQGSTPLSESEGNDPDSAQEAIQSMTEAHHHLGPHFKWTTLRPPTPEDLRRAEHIVETLRDALKRYQDYRVAIRDGFTPFLPNVPQRHYHFTKKWYGFKAAFTFNPEEPTSLLYQKTADGFRLTGAMYTARKGLSEDGLHDRVPLSVARWHAHVNICLPPRGQGRRADWTKFGPRGSIATPEACDAAGGRFFPQLFGWMLHVYPFEESPEKIWTH